MTSGLDILAKTASAIITNLELFKLVFLDQVISGLKTSKNIRNFLLNKISAGVFFCGSLYICSTVIQ